MTPPRAFLLGHPVAHSRSPLLHGYWLRTLALPGRYELQDVSPDELDGFFAGLRARGFVGGNVTVPHKVAVLRHVDRLDAAAQAIGAVNTIWAEGDAWVGGNTDAAGFLANLDDRAPGWEGEGRAVVLGAGGAARAAIHALRGRGVQVHVANRTVQHAAALAGPSVDAHGWDALPGLLAAADLVVNTTSLGMAGKPELPIDLGRLPRHAVVYDIVYVPLQTALLRAAAARGNRTVDGLGMLLHQGVPGFAHWFGRQPTVTAELRALIAADIPAR